MRGHASASNVVDLGIPERFKEGSQRVMSLGRALNPRPTAHEPFETPSASESVHGNIEGFREWLLVEQQKSKRTAGDYCARIKLLQRRLGGLTYDAVRGYLRRLREEGRLSSYSVVLSALKSYTHYIGYPEMFSGFKHPHEVKPKRIFNVEDVRIFYYALSSLRMKGYFLVSATSGLRFRELLGLRMQDVDFRNHLLTPNHITQTKRSWLTFYNSEAQDVLNDYLQGMTSRQRRSGKLFLVSSRDFKEEWKEAREATGIRLRPKDLRDFFCQRMGELGVPDRFIDAFCGRIPKSILARHYSDYSPERLKRIYDHAGLKVLSD